MIKIIETPQRADIIISSQIENDILTITIDEVSEVFDFTEMPEGKAESITPEILTINPILSAEKIGEEITIELIRFYSFEEKELFETPIDPSEIIGGGLLG